MLLLLRLFKDELAHKLSEQLAHGVHALLACCHVIDGVAHGEEDRLHSSSVRTVVHLDIALAYVADSDDSRGGLQLLQGFLEAIESADLCNTKSWALANLFVSVRDAKKAVASQLMFLSVISFVV